MKTQSTHICRLLNVPKITRFLGGPNRPEICVWETKFNFKDLAWNRAQNFWVYSELLSFFSSVHIADFWQSFWVIWENGSNWSNLRLKWVFLHLEGWKTTMYHIYTWYTHLHVQGRYVPKKAYLDIWGQFFFFFFLHLFMTQGSGQ